MFEYGQGLNNLGKTTIVLKINGEDTRVISPTLGFNIKNLTFDKYVLYPCLIYIVSFLCVCDLLLKVKIVLMECNVMKIVDVRIVWYTLMYKMVRFFSGSNKVK